MAGLIKIYRGATLICDGLTAFVDGCPLADCEHALDVFNLARALQASVIDLDTKSITITIRISRQFGSSERAMDHAFRGPATGSGQYDLVIVVNDGIADHTWTLSDATGDGAAWKQVSATDCNGVRTAIEYQVTGGFFTYDGPFDATYDDSMTDPAGDGTLVDTGALTATP